jgi:CHAD domain-containing protein
VSCLCLRAVTSKAPRTVIDLMQSVCADSLARLRKHRARSLKLEAEPVHQMRVATRRLRASLRIFYSLMDAQWADELEQELRWLAHLLGNVRDLDVLRERLREAANPEDRRTLAPLQRLLGKRHRDAQTAMLEGLKSERYTELIERLRIGSHAPEMSIESGEPPLEILLPQITDAWKTLARAANKLSPNDASIKYHRVRKMAKRVRYATDALLPNVAHEDSSQCEDTEQFIKRIKKLQDSLGELQDAVVAEKTVSIILDSKLLAKHDRLEAAAKRLIASQKKAAKKAVRKFPKAWKAASDPKHRKWMKT